MTATELLTDLCARGVSLSLDGGRLKFRAPQGTVTAAVRGQVGECREELVALLEQERLEQEGQEVVTVSVLAGDGRTVQIPLGKYQEWAGVAKPPGPHPVPPPGALLCIVDAEARACTPEQVYMWTWEGDRSGWHYASEHPLPPFEMTLGPRFPKRCGQCNRRSFRVLQETYQNGTVHYRAVCCVCETPLGNVKKPPGNLDIEFRATGATA